MTRPEPGVCPACLRRAWALGELLFALDRRCTSSDRLAAALALPSKELIAALAGGRREELAARSGRLSAQDVLPGGVWAVCPHDSRYPPPLRSQAGAPALFLDRPPRRLSELAAAPIVAVHGATAASDHGLHLARRLGRSLAAAGMSVASLQLGGIAAAASSGAAEARREHLTVLPDGISPSCRDRPSSRLFLSALPPGRAGRRVGRLTAARVLGGLATVSVLVEGSGDDLEVSRAAGALARGVAAVPGRVGSPLSSGPHMLIREGARLVRDAADVLELIGRSPHPRCEEDRIGPDLDPDLGTLLEEVARGRDSAEALCAGAADPLAVLSGLTELELAGHLVRGDGGRYLLAGRAPDPSLAR